jgi:hypothetical protein
MNIRLHPPDIAEMLLHLEHNGSLYSRSSKVIEY